MSNEIDPFEIQRRLPTHQQRLAIEKQVNVYFVPGTDASGTRNYIYAVCSALLHEPFMEAIRLGVVPDYAVVVEMGQHEPSDAVKAKMLEYYGFEHGSEA